MSDLPLDKEVSTFRPEFVNLVEAVPVTYMVMATYSKFDGLSHLTFSFQRRFDGLGYATKKEAYAAARKELKDKGYLGRAFILEYDLGKEAEEE